MKVSRGDVVLVDYPYSDRTGTKVRPALVVQADALNSRITDTIIVAITRSTHRASATQLFIDLSLPDGTKTGLRMDSMVQCENILTIDTKFIVTRIGALSASLLDEVAKCLKVALDIVP